MAQADKKIARFLKVSNDLEQYLHSDGPLTPLELQTIETTIMGLQTLLESWMRKHRPVENSSVLSQVTARQAEES
jgi:hypothetical protein